MILGVYPEFIIRILAASLCGAAVGIEREHRQKGAGIRTHLIVALASALMMIVSKYGFYDVIGESIKLDPSRIAAGVVSAIGFLGAGIIYVRQNSAIGLTTAAGLWATIAIGLAVGAGMYFIAVSSTILLILIHKVLHWKKLPINRHSDAYIKMDLAKNGVSIPEIRNFLCAKGMSYRSFKLEKNGKGSIIFASTVTIDTRTHSFDDIRNSIVLEEIRKL